MVLLQSNESLDDDPFRHEYEQKEKRKINNTEFRDRMNGNDALNKKKAEKEKQVSFLALSATAAAAYTHSHRLSQATDGTHIVQRNKVPVLHFNSKPEETKRD